MSPPKFASLRKVIRFERSPSSHISALYELHDQPTNLICESAVAAAAGDDDDDDDASYCHLSIQVFVSRLEAGVR